MSWHEVCQFLDQSDPTGGLGTQKREKMLLDDLLLEGSSYILIYNAGFIQLYNNIYYKIYIVKYDLDTLPLSSHSFKIHKVKRGQGYHVWHCETDVIQGQSRMLAWMTYLKVPEEGGETEFLYQSKRIEPVIGRTLIWPAGFTHLHRGNPPLKGEKYYITGWFERA